MRLIALGIIPNLLIAIAVLVESTNHPLAFVVSVPLIIVSIFSYLNFLDAVRSVLLGKQKRKEKRGE
ncbi:MAG: hypothetical protein AAF846_22305 [Chloroflexota bacterium]